jgi:hypothetical protein
VVSLEKENIKLIDIQEFKTFLPIVFCIFITSRTKRGGNWVSVLGTVSVFLFSAASINAMGSTQPHARILPADIFLRFQQLCLPVDSSSPSSMEIQCMRTTNLLSRTPSRRGA